MYLPLTCVMFLRAHAHGKFKIEKLCYEEFLIFLNSGGVIIDAPHIPLNNTINKLIDKFDKFLSLFKSIFPLEMYICLSKE